MTAFEAFKRIKVDRTADIREIKEEQENCVELAFEVEKNIDEQLESNEQEIQSNIENVSSLVKEVDEYYDSLVELISKQRSKITSEIVEELRNNDDLLVDAREKIRASKEKIEELKNSLAESEEPEDLKQVKEQLESLNKQGDAVTCCEAAVEFKIKEDKLESFISDSAWLRKKLVQQPLKTPEETKRELTLGSEPCSEPQRRADSPSSYLNQFNYEYSTDRAEPSNRQLSPRQEGNTGRSFYNNPNESFSRAQWVYSTHRTEASPIEYSSDLTRFTREPYLVSFRRANYNFDYDL